MKRYMNYGGRSFAAGGAMPMKQLTEFNEGGRHEENGLGGIPQGMNPEGQMNLVEEGETKFDAENYIYSDSLKIDKELAEAFNLSPKMVGKTFADASKAAGRKKSKREGDAIEMAANEKDLTNLMEAQEAFKQKRIEEKLQEIAELDPNALPALMGQGQPQGGPQGDPAMGGQMQEAPMDEQAMMEQQMMAEQQGGGGQPSPEEMAMMEQQQNMAMGQQEGMMRNGGYATRSMALGGFGDPPYSKDPTADNYKPTDKYGQTNSPRTLEADEFIAASMSKLNNRGKVVGPLTKDETTSMNKWADVFINNHQSYPPYAPYNAQDEINENDEVVIPTFSNPGKYPMTKDGYVGYEPFEMYSEAEKAHRAKARLKTLADQEALKNKIKEEGFLETMRDSKRNGGYTRSYAPGGFMGANPGMMNMANAGAMEMGADPCPCGTAGCAPCPPEATPAGITTQNVTRPQETQAKGLGAGSRIGGLKFSPNLSSTEKAGFADDRVMQELRQSMLSQYGAAAIDSDPAYKTGVGTALIENTPPVKSNDFNVSEETSNSNLNPPKTGTYRPINQANKHNWFSKNIGQHFKAQTQKQRVKTPGIFHNRKRRGLEFGGNLMQPMNQMGSGGKMCYGCGGAMHNYGGRMNNMNQMASGGEIVAGIGSGLYGVGEGLLNTLTSGATSGILEKGYEALQEVGPMQGEDNIGDAIRGGANIAGAAGGAVLTGGTATGAAVTEGSSGTGDMLGAIGEETGNETLGKVGKGVEGAGQVAGMFIGGGGAGSAAGKVAEGAGTVAAGAGTLGAGAKVADAAKTAEAASKGAEAAKFAKVGEIASNKGVQAGLNMGTQVLENSTAKAKEERLAKEERMRVEREMMMTNDPTSPYYNSTAELPPLTLGQGGYMGTRSYGKGGGLWANIQAKKERMGSNYRPAQPGDPNRPTAEAIKASQNAMGGRLYNTGGPLTLKKNTTNPDGTTIEQDVTYNSLEELLADTEMVNKYGGKEATKQAFAARFKKSSIPGSISDPIGTMTNQILNPETEENPAMISYINKFKEQEEADRKEEIESTINTMREKSEYMPQIKQMPILPAGMLTAPQTNQQMVIPDAPIVENEPTLVDPTVVQTPKTKAVVDPNKDKDDNEVDVDVDQTDVNRDFTFKESPGQFAAKMAAPMMNLYSGLVDKYDPRFEPEFQKVEAPKLDYTESINSIRRNSAKIKKSFNKVGSNPSNLLALSQQTNSLEAQAIQQIDVINAKLEFEGDKLNNAQKQRLEKTKKELQLGFEEAKRKSLQAAAEQFQQISTTNQANELAQQYAAMGAENVGKVEYQTLVEQLGDLLRKRKEKKNKKK